jgi:hypothetical protein
VDQDSTFPPCHPTRLIHTSHSLQYPDRQDITWSPPWCFLSWFVHKTYVVPVVLDFRALLSVLSRNSGIRVHLQIQKVVTLAQPRDHLSQAAGCISPGKGRDPLPEWNVKSQRSPQIVGIKTHKRQRKSWQGNFLLIKRVQACAHSSWANIQAQNGWWWLLLISMTQSYLLLTWDLSRSEVHSCSWLAKRLAGWVRHAVWWATELYRNPEEARTL